MTLKLKGGNTQALIAESIIIIIIIIIILRVPDIKPTGLQAES